MAVGICASRSYRETRCDSPSQLAFPARGTTAKVNFRSYVSFGRSTVGWGQRRGLITRPRFSVITAIGGRCKFITARRVSRHVYRRRSGDKTHLPRPRWWKRKQPPGAPASAATARRFISPKPGKVMCFYAVNGCGGRYKFHGERACCKRPVDNSPPRERPDLFPRRFH